MRGASLIFAFKQGIFMKRLPILVSFIFILSLAVSCPLGGYAQGDPGCDPLDPAPSNCRCPGSENNPLCPIDGGVSFLIAAGIGLAAKKAHHDRKNKKLRILA